MIRALSLPALPRLFIAATLRRWQGLHRQRVALSQLEPHLLDDIGVSSEQAQREASRAPWDAPDHWRV